MAAEMAEPATKRVKLANGEQVETVVETTQAEEEPAKELELDAPASKAATIKEPVVFHTHETTLNVLPGTVNGVLKTISDGGLQYLLGGARCCLGLKSGRYMFEVKIIELVSPVQDVGARTGHATQVLRLGLSAGGSSSLFLGDAEDSVCFDMDGFFTHNQKRTQVMQRAGRDTVLAVVLNLDTTSANANTVSLFRDGERASPPQPLPEALRNRPLYPAVTFKNVTAFANFGPPLEPLPFKCRTVQDAELKHAVVTAGPEPKSGKHEVVFPVCLPDEGAFDWADLFLEQNPDFTELSDRMILDWAKRSGLSPTKGGAMSSLDKPETVFNLPFMDDGSVRHILQQFCPIQRRNFLVLEVKGGLLSQDREKMLSLWPTTHFRRVAKVLVGEPAADFRKRTAELILKEKQIVSDADFKLQKARERASRHQAKVKKQLEKKQRKMKREQKKAEKERVKTIERLKKAKADAEAKAQKEAEDKAKELQAAAEKAEADEKTKAEQGDKDQDEKDDKDDKEEAKEKPDTTEKEKDKDEMMEDAAKESAASESEKSEEEEEEPEEAHDEEPPRAELTEEEKKIVVRKKPISDLTPHTLNTTFTKFSLPAKDEGFDEITYDWTKTEAKSQDCLKAWVLGKKQTTRIEDLQPSKWFSDEYARWQKQVQVWHGNQNDYKAKMARAAAEKQERNAKALVAKQMAEQSAKLLEARKAAANKRLIDAETEEAKAEAEKELKALEEAEEAAAAAPKPVDEGQADKEASKSGEEEVGLDFEELDVFGVEDVSDIGDSSPLCRDFGFEDWAIMSLRFEIQLLAISFVKDAGDPDRTGIHVDHLAFYYQKYFRKPLNLKYYGIESNQGLLALIDDSVNLKASVVTSRFRERLESLATFMMLTEEARRYRCCRVDLGEEDARLRIVQPQTHTNLSSPAGGYAQRQQNFAHKGGWKAHSKDGKGGGGFGGKSDGKSQDDGYGGKGDGKSRDDGYKGGQGVDRRFQRRSGQQTIPVVHREANLAWQQPKGAAKGAKGAGSAVLGAALAQAGASPAAASAVAAALQAAHSAVQQQEHKGHKGGKGGKFQSTHKGGKGAWGK